MFGAIKRLNRKKPENQNQEGKSITNEAGKQVVIEKFFKEKFYDAEIPTIESFEGEPRRLNNQITARDV